jgi:hypothetical protein
MKTIQTEVLICGGCCAGIAAALLPLVPGQISCCGQFAKATIVT